MFGHHKDTSLLHRNKKLRIEQLEERQMLAAENFFAKLDGEVSLGSVTQIAISLQPGDFRLGNGSGLVEFRIASAQGSDLNPAPVQITDSGGTPLFPLAVADDDVAGTASATFSLSHGDYTVFVGGELGSSGVFEIEVAIPGDGDNDQDIDGADFLNWQRNFGTSLNPLTGDFNGDGVTNGFDMEDWIAGFGISAGANLSDGDGDRDGDADGNDFLLWQRTFAPQAGTPKADFNQNGEVDGADLNSWQVGYGTSGNAKLSDGDADHDQDVGGADFLEWQRQFGSKESDPIPGDSDGDRDVDAIDLQLIQGGFGASTSIRPFSLAIQIAPLTQIAAEAAFVTSADEITIFGTAIPNADIVIDADGDGAFDDGSVVADSEGEFSIDVSLQDGTNAVAVRATDSFGQFRIKEIIVTLDAPVTPFAVISPSDGEELVSLTREVDVRFEEAIDPATVDSQSLKIIANGVEVSGRIAPSTQTGLFVKFFPDDPWPATTEIRVMVNGDLIARADGTPLNAGVLTADFRTLSDQSVPRTELFTVDVALVSDLENGLLPQAIVDGLSAVGVTLSATVEVKARIAPHDGEFLILDFADGDTPLGFVVSNEGDALLVSQATIVRARVFASERGLPTPEHPEGVDMPLAGVTIRVDSLPEANVVTDAEGYFELVDVPSPDFFIHIDGGTATSVGGELPSDDGFYPSVGKLFHSVPGEVLVKPFDIFLPFVPDEAVHEVVPGEDMTVQLPDSQLAEHPELGMVELTVPADSLRMADGSAASFVGISVVDPERLPAPLPPGANHDFDITIQAPAGAFFDTPAPISFPNTRGWTPGSKAQLISFDHAVGEWTTSGTMTVSEDGLRVLSDPGSGILAPGWHWMDQLVDVYVDTFGGGDPDKALEVTTTAIGLGVDLFTTFSGGPLLKQLMTQYVDSHTDLFIAAASGGVSSVEWVSIAAGYTSGAILAGTFATSLFVPIAPVVFAGLTGAAAGLSIASFVINVGTAIDNLYACLNDSSNAAAHASLVAGSADSAKLSGALASFDRASANALIRNAISHLETVRTLGNKLLGALNEFDHGYLQGVVDIVSLGLEDKLGAAWLNYDYELDATNDRLLVYEKGTTNLAIDSDTGQAFDLSIASIITGLTLSQAELDQLAATINLPDLAERSETVDRLVGSSSPLVRSSRAAIASLNRAADVLGTGTDGVFYALAGLSGTTIARGRADSAGSLFQRLPAFSTFDVSYYNPNSLLSGTASFTTGRGGSTLHVSHDISTLEVPAVLEVDISISSIAALFAPSGNDPDGDGLGSIAEKAIGTNPNAADSDGDGIDDFTEVQQGLDPLGGRGFPTGVIASVGLMGEANEVVIASDVEDESTRTAFVATGSHGLAVVDVSQFTMPIVQGQLDLNGDAVDVAVDSGSQVAVIASGVGGLHFVDVSDTMMPTLIRTIDSTSNQVEIFRGIVYSVNSDRVETYELLSGLALESFDIDTGNLTGLAIDRNTLFTMDENRNLTAVDISGFLMQQLGAVTLPDGGGKLFVSGGIAYAVATSSGIGGFATVDVSNPESLIVLSGTDVPGNGRAPKAAIAENGSGKAILVGPLLQSNRLAVLDVTDPTNTNENVVGFGTGDAPNGVFIASGIAFVADEAGRLSVVNYLPFDIQGVEPTVSITSPIEDADPGTPGIQVMEGAAVQIFAAISDDFEDGDGRGQVRNVELIVNGQIVINDVSAPFDLLAFAPSLGLGDESFTVQVRATDTGGNAGLSNVLTFDLIDDTEAPQLLGNNLGAEAIGFDIETILLSFSEPLDTGRVRFSEIMLVNIDDGSEVPLLAVSTPGDQQIAIITTSSLPRGQFRLTINASNIADRAGNTATEPIEFEFSNVASIDGVNQWITGDGEWTTGFNWSDGQVPVANDDVSIDIPGRDVTVRLSSGGQQVHDLVALDNVTITGGSLTLHGEGNFEGAFSIINGATLAVDGAESSVIISGETAVDGGRLIARNTGALFLPTASSFRNGRIEIDSLGTIDLPEILDFDFTRVAVAGGSVFSLPSTITSYTSSGGLGINQFISLFSADGPGSVIDISSIQTFEASSSGLGPVGRIVSVSNGGVINMQNVSALTGGGGGDDRLIFRARSGGRFEYSALSSISGSNIIFELDSPGGGLNYDGLTNSLTSISGSNILFDLDSSVVNFNSLLTATGANFVIDNDNTYNAPNLTSWTNGQMTLSGSSFFNADALENIDSTKISLSAGGVYAFPQNVTSYTSSGGLRPNQVITLFSVDGAGSLLDLSSLETFEASSSGLGTVGRVVSVSNGGQINMANTTSITGGGDHDDFLLFRASGGGQFNYNGLTTIAGVNIRFDLDTSTVNFSSLISAVGARFIIDDNNEFNAPNMTTWTHGQLTLSGSSSFNTEALENIDYTQFFLSAGGEYTLPPSVASYTSSGGLRVNQVSTLFSVDGAGSRLDLTSLQSFDASSGGLGAVGRVVSVSNGGVINLSNTSSVTGGGTGDDFLLFQATGGSQLFFDGLDSISGSNIRFNINSSTLALGTTSSSTTVSGVRFDFAGSNDVSLGTVMLSGGTVLAGDATMTGNLINGARIDLGRKLTIVGSFTQTALGALNVGIAGSNDGEFDALTINGTASFAGTLNVSLDGGFTPGLGDPDLSIISFVSATGSFSSINSLDYDVQQDASAIRLSVPIPLEAAIRSNSPFTAPLLASPEFAFPHPPVELAAGVRETTQFSPVVLVNNRIEGNVREEVFYSYLREEQKRLPFEEDLNLLLPNPRDEGEDRYEETIDELFELLDDTALDSSSSGQTMESEIKEKV